MDYSEYPRQAILGPPNRGGGDAKTEICGDAICECSLLEAAGVRPEESLLLAVAGNLHEDLDVRRVGEPPDQRVGPLPLGCNSIHFRDVPKPVPHRIWRF